MNSQSAARVPTTSHTEVLDSPIESNPALKKQLPHADGRGREFALTAGLFFAGWSTLQFLQIEFVYEMWMWASFAVAAIMLIDGSWKVVPRMLLGFAIGKAIGWTLFYVGDWYYPDADDVLYISTFAACVAALLGSRFLISHADRCPTGNSSNIPSRCAPSISEKVGRAIPFAGYYASVLLSGGYAGGWSNHAVHRITAAPELVAVLAALVLSLGIMLLPRAAKSAAVTVDP